MWNIFEENVILEIFQILSAILLIGNIKFDLWEMDDSAILTKDSVLIAKTVSELLKVNQTDFANFLIFKKSNLAQDEIQTNF